MMKRKSDPSGKGPRLIYLSMVCTLMCGMNSVHAQQQLATIRLDGPVDAATVSPDGRYVAATILNAAQKADGSWDYAESIQVYDPASSRMMSRIDIPSVSRIKDGSLFGSPFIGYCDNGKYLVAYDKISTLYVLNASSYQVESKINIGDWRAQAGGDQVLGTMMTCSAGGSVFAANGYGGRLGWGLVRLFDLTTGEQIAELQQNPSSGTEFGRISLSPNGSEVAILLKNPRWGSIKGPNVEIRETKHLSLLNRFSTGDAPDDLIFSGESEIATVQGQKTARFASRRIIQLWNVESGKEEKRFSDTQRNVMGSVGSSANGGIILGYIPTYHDCALCNGLEGSHDLKEQRFAVWNKNTGSEVFRSEAFGPIVAPISPSLVLSQNGAVVMVYWHAMNFAPRLFPIRQTAQ
jgi:WD40 repeat protein